MSKVNALAQEIAMLMPVIARRVLLDFYQNVEISQSQILMIMSVKQIQPCRLSDLSEEMNISPPTTCGIVDRLEKAGYVLRQTDTEDRRAVSISLTEKGEDVAQTFRSTVQKRWAEILDRLPVADGENFVRILNKVRDVLE